VTEVPVNHRARQFGRSKYGISRTIRVMLDLITVWFLGTYSTRPIHVFGTLGLASMGVGALFGLYLTFIKLFLGAEHWQPAAAAASHSARCHRRAVGDDGVTGRDDHAHLLREPGQADLRGARDRE
jgi:hypothetical protein